MLSCTSLLLLTLIPLPGTPIYFFPLPTPYNLGGALSPAEAFSDPPPQSDLGDPYYACTYLDHSVNLFRADILLFAVPAPTLQPVPGQAFTTRFYLLDSLNQLGLNL